jgi:hypothetical protein
MTSYRTFFAIVLTMALLGASGCAEDLSSATADDEQISSNEAALDNAPGDEPREYTPEELDLADHVVASMRRLPTESARVDWLISRMPAQKQGSWECVGGAIALAGTMGSCLAGNPFACVGVIGGTVTLVSKCGGGPGQHDVSCSGQMNHQWCI